MQDQTPTKALITLTDTAAARIKALVEKSGGKCIGLRLGVSTKGCSGLSYTMETVEEIRPHDEVVKEKGVTVIIDPYATMFIVGTEMDYVEGQMQSGFVFTNPNEKSRCGCGESFSV